MRAVSLITKGMFYLKMKKMMIGLALATVIAPVGLATGVPVTAQAKNKLTMKSFPKRYRRTWYHYDGKGKYDKLSFTSKAEKWDDDGEDSGTQYLHVRARNANPYKAETHSHWITGTPMTVRHAHWISVYGWNQLAGYGIFYKVTNKTYKSTKYQVLTYAAGAGLAHARHYYKTQKIAKKIGNHHFKGEVY